MEISHRMLNAAVTLVHLNGRLDAAASAEVKATLQQLLAQQPKLIVDLQQVPFIDSSGLAALVSGLRLAREKGGNIALCGVQPQAETVFRLTMLDRIFPIYANCHEAEQGF